VVSVRRLGSDLEVSTTSQELAHRMVRELVKAFGGRARYSWSDGDGGLFATWTVAGAETPRGEGRGVTRVVHPGGGQRASPRR
jgi:hypothetical protein